MLSEINPPLIEKFKQKRLEGKTMYKRQRNPATVNRELCEEWVQRIVTMAINTGMRQGEIFNLTWFDVDLPRGVIHIRVSKNGKDRFVPINQTVRAMLEGLPHTSEYVFPSPKTEGRLIDVKRRFDLAKSDAGIKDFRFHVLPYSGHSDG